MKQRADGPDYKSLTYMPLYNGNRVDYADPQSLHLDIQTVAHSLSMLCRFNGHCHWFYSVAQHSVHCCDLAGHVAAYEALMHDVVECVVGDMVKPQKASLPGYQTQEEAFEKVILGKFGLTLPLHPRVKEVDMIMLATEQVQLTDDHGEWTYTGGHQPADLHIPVWSPIQARKEFLSRYYRLRGDG